MELEHIPERGRDHKYFDGGSNMASRDNSTSNGCGDVFHEERVRHHSFRLWCAGKSAISPSGPYLKTMH